MAKYGLYLEKEMATHSNILAWRIPWTEEPVAYSPRCPRVGQDLEIKQQWSLSNILLYFEIKFKIWKKGKVILKTVK